MIYEIFVHLEINYVAKLTLLQLLPDTSIPALQNSGSTTNNFNYKIEIIAND